MSKTPFPVFKLPDLLLRMIATKWTTAEIVTLAMCSKKTKNALKSLLSDTEGACTVYLAPTCLSIEFIFFKNRSSLYWMILDEFPKTGREEDIVFEGIPMQILPGYYKITKVVSDDLPEAFQAILNLIFSLFTAPIDVCLRPGTRGLLKMLNNPHFEHCDELTVHRGFGTSSYGEEISAIFEHIKSCNKMTIGVDLDFKLDAIFNTRFVRLANAMALAPADLLRFINCSRLVVTRHRFQSEDLEEFFLKWLNEKDTPPQKRFRFGWRNNPLPVFSRLPTMRWSSERRSKTCFPLGEANFLDDFEYALDIERADGLLASIAIINGHLVFYVWHERFPTKKEEDDCRAEIEKLYEQIPRLNEECKCSHPLLENLLDRDITSDKMRKIKEELMEITWLDEEAKTMKWAPKMEKLIKMRERIFALTASLT